MSESSHAAEVTKQDRRISKAMVQEENDIKDAVAGSSSEPKLDFHLTDSRKRYHDNALEGKGRKKKNTTVVEWLTQE